MGRVTDPRRWAAPGPTGVRRFVPIVNWLPRYDRSFVRYDAIAGATVWGLLVPESIAYAGLAGLPPQTGLYTLVGTLAAYAVFGTSRHLIAGPTSAAAVLLASSVGALDHVNTADYAADAVGLVVLCGGLFLVAGLLRLGFIAQFLSRPVVECFVFGLAIFVIVSQLAKLFGIEKGTGDTIKQFVHVVTHLGDTNWATLAVGAMALAVLFAIDRFAPKLPGGLIVLVGGIVVGGVFHLAQHGVAIVGHVPSGLPTPDLPSYDRGEVGALAASAGAMMLVIFSESLGAANNFALKHGYEVDANQEMIALGVANTSSGLLGGLAGGGSLSQSAVNDEAGARSEASPLIAAALIVVTLLIFTPLFKNLPEAVLAALIIHAVSRLLRFGRLRRLYAARRIEFVAGIATLLGVIVLDVLPGLVIGVGMMLLLVIYSASRPNVAALGRLPTGYGAFGALDHHPDAEAIPGLLILRLQSPIFYANARPLRDEIMRIVGQAQPIPHTLVLEMGGNYELDVTSADLLGELVTSLHDAGIEMALTDVREPVIAMARRTGLLAAIGERNVFHTVEEAVAEKARPAGFEPAASRSGGERSIP